MMMMRTYQTRLNARCALKILPVITCTSVASCEEKATALDLKNEILDVPKRLEETLELWEVR